LIVATAAAAAMGMCTRMRVPMQGSSRMTHIGMQRKRIILIPLMKCSKAITTMLLMKAVGRHHRWKIVTMYHQLNCMHMHHHHRHYNRPLLPPPMMLNCHCISLMRFESLVVNIRDNWKPLNVAPCNVSKSIYLQ